jgi:D-alanine-D-alanine ligase
MITTKPCDPAKTKVVLLKGGKSGERDISLQSGEACARALVNEGFSVVEIDTASDGMLEMILEAKPDVVFLALHGKDGEDGCVQGFCELMGVPYTGPGVLASALAMDKVRAKVFYRSAGLDTANWTVVNKGELFSPEEIIARVGSKCVVKPDHEGSALGVHIVDGVQELSDAIEEALTHDSSVIIETFVSGTETTVAVFGNDDPEVLPVIEIVPQASSDFYDFTAKYATGGATHIIPARLNEDTTKACQDAALAAHKALGCRGVSRTDIIVDESGTCWVLETNTIPGMTATSLLPDAAAKVGIPFGTLCRMLVELALEEHA